VSAIPIRGSWADGYEFDERGRPMAFSQATPQLIEQLAAGCCHAVALVLHERHGWEMRGLGRPADSYSFSPWRGLSVVPRHVYCLRDDGLPVDIHGLFADEQAICRFYAHQHAPDERLISISLSADDVRDELPQRGFSPLYDEVLAYVREVVDQLGLDQLEVPRPALEPTSALPDSTALVTNPEPPQPER
jgi:hypothetical protein